MSILLNILLPVFLVAGVAALAQPRLKLNIQTFSRAAFYLFSPAMVLDALVNSDVSGAEFGQIAVALFLTSLTLWGIGEVVARLLGLDNATRSAFLVGVILSNSGNYGLPVNLFAFGEAGLARAALFVTVNSVMRSSLGVYLSARGTTASLRGALREVFSAPVIYAAGLGLVVNLMGWTLPEPVLRAAHLLGQGLVPASLMVLGIQIAQTAQERRAATGKDVPALTALSLGRLILAPIIASVVGSLVGLQALAHDVVVLQSATPTAVMSLVLASEFRSNVSFAALAILITTLVSLATVTLWLHLLIA